MTFWQMEYRKLSDGEYADMQKRILYEDNHILILNKRCGEIVQGDRSGDEPLAETLKAFIAMRDGKPGKVFIGLPHRLDRPVSGIVMFAKTSKALERLAGMFRDGTVKKTYLALCCAAPPERRGELRDTLVRNEKMNKSFVVSDAGRHPDGKEAVLRYSYAGHTDRYHLLAVRLLTGRHHQIRCQLSHIGCPIKGDLKYGAPRSNADGGICLHSYCISFEHPVKKTGITVTAPVPPSWKGVEPLLSQVPSAEEDWEAAGP